MIKSVSSSATATFQTRGAILEKGYTIHILNTVVVSLYRFSKFPNLLRCKELTYIYQLSLTKQTKKILQCHHLTAASWS